MQFDSAIHQVARGEAFEPAIQPRVIRIGRLPQRWFHHALLLEEGSLRLSRDSAAAPVAGPAIAFFPPSDGETITLMAGSRGYLVGLSPEIVGEALGDHAESAALRVFAGAFSLDDALGKADLSEILPLFGGVIAELADERRGSRMVVAAYARLIIMSLSRLRGADTEGEVSAGASSILQRFRQSVEIDFRRHRSIADYAEGLGISPDRLHAICQRMLSRSPIELVHSRMMQEAKLRLERSARSIQEISYGLGFRDPANFSHFFKRKAGVSPARYRALAISHARAPHIETSSDYHEWP